MFDLSSAVFFSVQGRGHEGRDPREDVSKVHVLQDGSLVHNRLGLDKLVGVFAAAACAVAFAAEAALEAAAATTAKRRRRQGQVVDEQS